MTKIHSINSNQFYIAQNAEVSLKLAGNTAQVTFTAGKNRKCTIKNLSKDEFVDLSTGEVKERRHSENRFQLTGDFGFGIMVGFTWLALSGGIGGAKVLTIIYITD